MTRRRLRTLLGGAMLLALLAGCSLLPAPQVTSTPVASAVQADLKPF
jgi:hypothetical protein